MTEAWDYAKFPVTYPCLTVWEPWATLITVGAKPFEFRSWPSLSHLVGQRVAIQAGAHPISVAAMKILLMNLERQPNELGITGLRKSLALPILERAVRAPKSFPFRHIVCVATHGRPIRNEALSAELGIDRILDSDRTEHSNWGWPLTDIEPIYPPVPIKGQQGWFRWTRTA